LTNKAPLDARERFLEPDAFIQVRQINPEVNARTERAIDWAMSLHPDERPDSVEIFRESLLGDREFVRTPLNRPTRPGDLLSTPLERFLLWVAAGLTIISLLATLAR